MSGLEFLGRLAGGLVHEIKNPLSTLRINLTLLKEDLGAAHPGERSMLHRIDVLEKEVARLDAILSDFMRYAGVRRLEKKTADLRALVHEMIEFIGPGFKRDGIEVTVEVAAHRVDVDAALYKQALLNILLNAQQADGTTRIRVTGADGVIEIEDNGAGIPEADREMVFHVYYSGSKAGSGLGLPTARRILEEHGGGLEIFSKEGAGTRVRLWL